MKICSPGYSGFMLTLPTGEVLVTNPWLGPLPLKGFRTPDCAKPRASVRIFPHGGVTYPRNARRI